MDTQICKIACPECQKSLKVKLAADGKVIQCPGCKKPFRFRAPRNTPKPTAPSQDFDFGNLKPDLSDTSLFDDLPVSVTGPINPGSVNRVHNAEPTSRLAAAPGPSLESSKFTPPTSIKNAFAGQNGSLSSDQVERLKDSITEQLSSKLPKHRVGLLYRFSMLVTACFMLILPLAYCGLILASGYALYYYTSHIIPSSMPHLPRGRAVIFGFAILIAPIIAGCAVILFMIKPVFLAVMIPRDSRQRSLKREGEPLLFHLVDKICEAARAPKPNRINVDCNVNASAGYGSGLRSLFSNDLTLTIGAPLITGLTTQQFAGILAHEFGHFAQGGGMRTSYIVRSVNAWFAKVVYQRDAIDTALDEIIEESESIFGLVLMFAKLFVIITRAIMWCFMMAAHAGSCFLMRQMEFDADRYEVELCGSENFQETCESLRILSASESKSMMGLIQLVHQGVLIDNIPYLIEQVRNGLTTNERDLVLQSLRTQNTGFFDSHPADAARIKAAKSVNLPGIFDFRIPARNFLQHYDSLCKNVTQDFYRNQLDRMINPAELKSTHQYVPKVQAIKMEV